MLIIQTPDAVSHPLHCSKQHSHNDNAIKISVMQQFYILAKDFDTNNLHVYVLSKIPKYFMIVTTKCIYFSNLSVFANRDLIYFTMGTSSICISVKAAQRDSFIIFLTKLAWPVLKTTLPNIFLVNIIKNVNHRIQSRLISSAHAI